MRYSGTMLMLNIYKAQRFTMSAFLFCLFMMVQGTVMWWIPSGESGAAYNVIIFIFILILQLWRLAVFPTPESYQSFKMCLHEISECCVVWHGCDRGCCVCLSFSTDRISDVKSIAGWLWNGNVSPSYMWSLAHRFCSPLFKVGFWWKTHMAFWVYYCAYKWQSFSDGLKEPICWRSK